jgi:hypothetical protein
MPTLPIDAFVLIAGGAFFGFILPIVLVFLLYRISEKTYQYKPMINKFKIVFLIYGIGYLVFFLYLAYNQMYTNHSTLDSWFNVVVLIWVLISCILLIFTQFRFFRNILVFIPNNDFQRWKHGNILGFVLFCIIWNRILFIIGIILIILYYINLNRK